MTAKKPTPPRLQVRRVYEPPAENDGLRVLVDRLWPRGLTKQKARVDLWLKDVAPSDALRKRFHGNPAQWSLFVSAYGRELRQEPAKSAVANLREQIKHGHVTLLYAARDEAHNNAVALKNWIARKS